MTRTIIAAFGTQAEAESAVNELEAQGFNPKDISVISKAGTTSGTGENVAEGAVSGATTGGVIGGLAGLLAGAGVLPALAGLLIGGPIAAALGATGVVASVVSGAVTGAAAGGLIGALVKLGVPDEDARYYNERVNAGGFVIAVPTQSTTGSAARDILVAHGADRINEVEV